VTISRLPRTPQLPAERLKSGQLEQAALRLELWSVSAAGAVLRLASEVFLLAGREDFSE
jgi:hypothetical protein